MMSLLWMFLAMAPTPAIQAAPEREVVTTCTSLEGKSVEAAKAELLLTARREAVEKLLGSAVAGVTRVENLRLEKDRIEQVSAGSVRLDGEPEYFNGQQLGELCVKIRAYALEEDRAAVDAALRALLQGQGPPKFVLDADLNLLSLGSRAALSVTAVPPKALEGARCEWTVEPAGVLKGSAPKGACRLDVAMPDAPLAGRASTLPARISVRIRRGDEVLDELTVRGAVHNGLAIEPVVAGTTLQKGTATTVRIVPRGRPDPLPPGFTCVWSVGGAPLAFTPSADNGCAGRLELKPEEDWTLAEGMGYALSLQHAETVSVNVRVLHRGGLVNEGSADVELRYLDSRDPQELLRHFTTFKPRGGIGGTDDYLTRAGLPTLGSLNEKNLELRLAFANSSFNLETWYTGNQPAGLRKPLDDSSGFLRVVYSRDGQTFGQWLLSGARTAEELAGLDHVWVQIRNSLGGEPAGPFRLPLDAPQAARAALTEAWQALDPDEKRRFACGLVKGMETVYADQARHFLVLLDQVSIGRGAGALWRTQRFGGRLEDLSEKKFDRLAPPAGPLGFIARLRFVDGKDEDYTCPSDTTPGRRKEIVGSYYRLKRTAGKGAEWPDEIEIYLEYRESLGWTVSFGRDLDPAFVRISSGAGFKTVEKSALDGDSIRFKEAEGKQLILRFVTANGEEVEYNGPVDYEAQRFSALRDGLFSRSRLACESYGVEERSEYDDEDRRPVGIEGPAVVCGFAIGGGEYMPVSSALPVLRSVVYGCVRDQLTREDRFEEERALGAQGKWEELTFALPGSCDTVFARFTLTDGSTTDVLAAPVTSP